MDGDATESGQRVLRVAVAADGSTSLDGASVSLAALRETLAAAKDTGAVVWYYRENAWGNAPAEATEVIQAIVDNGLPISLSTEPDFSTVVDEDGTVRRR